MRNKSNWLYFKKYKNNKVFLNYFKTLMIALLVPTLIINILVFAYYSKMMTNKSVSVHANELYNHKYIFDQAQNDAQRTYDLLYYNEFIKKYMDITNIYDDYGINTTYFYQSFFKSIYNYIGSNSNINSIYLYNDTTKYVFGTNYTGSLDDMADSKWYDTYLENDSQNYIICRTSVDNAKNKLLTFCYKYVDDKKVKGLVIINFNDKFTSNNIAQTSTLLGIASQDGKIIQSSDESIIGKNFSDFKEYEKILSSPTSGTMTSGVSFKNILSFIKSGSTSHIYFALNKGVYTTFEYINISIVIFLCIFLTIGISLLIAYLLSKKLYRSIAAAMAILEEPNIADTPYEDKSNEFMFIIDNIVRNTKKINEINEELSKKLAMLKKAQTIALQTQITPHFLYNTLQAINLVTIKLLRGDNDASKMIILFSEILQTALDTDNYLVPLNQEIRYAKDYLKLQNYKYENKFKVIWNIPDNIKQIKFLKLSLQPILENAILYGVTPQFKKCTIEISAKCIDDNVVVSIANNGEPISEEKIQELTESFLHYENIKETKSIGLCNTNQRIKIIFGNDYGCSVKMENSKTVVSITIPIVND